MTRGFLLTCPHCGAEDAMKIHTSDLGEIMCTECEAGYRPDDIRDFVATWTAFLGWWEKALEMAPPIKG
jgi:uncharacterized protein (DUF983 family)